MFDIPREKNSAQRADPGDQNERQTNAIDGEMIIHSQHRDPGNTHDGGEMGEVDLIAEKRRQTDHESDRSRYKGDPARESTRHKEQHDRADKSDVNRPGDHARRRLP